MASSTTGIQVTPIWTNIKLRHLISEFRNHSVLWDPKHRDFRDRARKSEAWCDLAARLGLERYVCERKMNILRTQFRREWNRKKERSFGADSKWHAYGSMKFLEGVEQRHVRKRSEGDSAMAMESNDLPPTANSSTANNDLKPAVKTENQEKLEEYSIDTKDSDHKAENVTMRGFSQGPQNSCPDITLHLPLGRDNRTASQDRAQSESVEDLSHRNLSEQRDQTKFKKPQVGAPIALKWLERFSTLVDQDIKSAKKAEDTPQTSQLSQLTNVRSDVPKLHALLPRTSLLNRATKRRSSLQKLNPTAAVTTDQSYLTTDAVSQLNEEQLSTLRLMLNNNSQVPQNVVHDVSDEEIDVTEPMHTQIAQTENVQNIGDGSEPARNRMLQNRNQRQVSRNHILAAKKQKAIANRCVMRTARRSGITMNAVEPETSMNGSRNYATEFVQDHPRRRQETRDVDTSYGEHVGFRLQNLSKRARTVATHLINGILYEADMGIYDTAESNRNSIYAASRNLVGRDVIGSFTSMGNNALGQNPLGHNLALGRTTAVSHSAIGYSGHGHYTIGHNNANPLYTIGQNNSVSHISHLGSNSIVSARQVPMPIKMEKTYEDIVSE